MGNAKHAERVDAIIVGAGLAGLVCCRELQIRGVCPVVLEASERIGGRCYTSRLSPSIPSFNHGAAWIHGTHPTNPLIPLCARLGVEWHEIAENNPWTIPGGGRTAWLVNGVVADPDVVGQAKGAYETVMQRVAHATHSPETTLGEALSEYGEMMDGEVGAVAGMMAKGLDWWNGCDLSELTAEGFEGWQGYTANHGGTSGDYPGPHAHIAAQSITDGLADEIRAHQPSPSPLRTAHHVTCITQLSDGTVEVTTECGRHFMAPTCVITVSVGVLKSGALAFTPPLPSSKQSAISGLQLGSYLKIVCEFSRVFWPSDTDFIIASWDTGEESAGQRTPLEANLQRPIARWAPIHSHDPLSPPALELVLTGSTGRCVGTLPQDQLRSYVCELLRRSFGDCTPEPTDVLRGHHWDTDPLVCGAYSHLPPNCDASAMQELARPCWDGALVWAGEATAEGLEGSLHAAVVSGERAATEVIQGRE